MIRKGGRGESGVRSGEEKTYTGILELGSDTSEGVMGWGLAMEEGTLVEEDLEGEGVVVEEKEALVEGECGSRIFSKVV